ncbi:MAG: hypothetical protein WCK31_05075 [bacterium]
MIRNSKNIKKIRLLYKESEKSNDNTEKVIETKIEDKKLETKTNIKVETNETLNTKYILVDIIKTAVFFILAMGVLYYSYRTNLFAMIFVK